jgi:hypothetical protein
MIKEERGAFLASALSSKFGSTAPPICPIVEYLPADNAPHQFGGFLR